MKSDGNYRKRLGKGLRAVTTFIIILSVTMGSLANIAPAFSEGKAPEYTIDITNVTGGTASAPPTFYTNPISISGTVAASNPVGQLEQHQVQVDWGDNTVDPDSAIDFDLTGNGDDFDGTWSSDPSHNYSAPGTYTISVTLYHRQYPGHERSDVAQVSITIDVIIPHAPVAVNDAYETDEDTQLSVVVPG